MYGYSTHSSTAPGSSAQAHCSLQLLRQAEGLEQVLQFWQWGWFNHPAGSKMVVRAR